MTIICFWKALRRNFELYFVISSFFVSLSLRSYVRRWQHWIFRWWLINHNSLLVFNCATIFGKECWGGFHHRGVLTVKSVLYFKRLWYFSVVFQFPITEYHLWLLVGELPKGNFPLQKLSILSDPEKVFPRCMNYIRKNIRKYKEK